MRLHRAAMGATVVVGLVLVGIVVNLSLRKHVTLVVDGTTLHSHAVGGTYQAAIDTVVDKAERQAVDHKRKPRQKIR